MAMSRAGQRAHVGHAFGKREELRPIPCGHRVEKDLSRIGVFEAHIPNYKRFAHGHYRGIYHTWCLH
jgi:hypothetical protein